jgi:uncharacterized phiE125 gp8 family phage protein
MSYKQVTGPEALPVSMDDVRLDLRDPDVALNGQIESIIYAVTAEVEHRLQRALITQTRRVTLDGFPESIKLDLAPVVSVESVKFYDTAGALQTLDPLDYYQDLVTEPGYIVPASGKAWPETLADQLNTVTVDYTCGYGATYESVPKAIQAYIRARTVQLFDDPGASEGFLGHCLDGFVVYS